MLGTLQEIFDLLSTFKRHLESVNPRVDLLEPFKHDLDEPDGIKQAEEERADPKIEEIEQDIVTFIKSISDITIEIRTFCEKSSKPKSS